MSDCLVSLNSFETEGANWQLSFKGKYKNPEWSFCPRSCWINSHTLTICATVQTKGCFQGWGICSGSGEIWKSVRQKRKHSCYSNLQGDTRHSLDMQISEKLGENIFSADWLMIKGHSDLKARNVSKTVWENVSHPRSELCQGPLSKFNSTIKLQYQKCSQCYPKSLEQMYPPWPWLRGCWAEIGQAAASGWIWGRQRRSFPPDILLCWNDIHLFSYSPTSCTQTQAVSQRKAGQSEEDYTTCWMLQVPVTLQDARAVLEKALSWAKMY